MAEAAILRRPRREWLAEAVTLMGFALVVAWLAAGGSGRLSPVVRRGQAHRASRHEVSLHPSAPGGADEGADVGLA